jgi:site-specific DNA-methyltransferase (adenine-specific)
VVVGGGELEGGALRGISGAETLVEACTVRGDLVLDPFAGSGTTCIVAALRGRLWLGIELNPQYAALANATLDERLRKMRATSTARSAASSNLGSRREL